MAKCRICGADFPNCYMDTVAICPKCGTVYANTSPTLENAEILSVRYDQKPAQSVSDGETKEKD